MSKKIVYYKATRPDGTDFHTGAVNYGAALATGETITHPTARKDQVGDRPSTYLSISTSATDCTGFSWPCRMFVVEPVGSALKVAATLPNKRRVSALRVVAELPAHGVFGPNGAKVAALIERAGRLTIDEERRLSAAWSAARDAAWYAARNAARNAALALVVQDLITEEHFNTLYGPWASVIGDAS